MLKMSRGLLHIISYSLIFTILLTKCCAKIKLYAVNSRTGGVTYSQHVRSLLVCSTLYVRSQASLSVNYDPGTGTCELSSHYLETSEITSHGWSVYSRMVDGVWTAWMSWGDCPWHCTTVQRTRTRSCSNPAPSNGGEYCPGISSQQNTCYVCPINGGWSAWASWSACSVTCGYGTMSRNRLCSNPLPRDGGTDCIGSNNLISSCFDAPCFMEFIFDSD